MTPFALLTCFAIISAGAMIILAVVVDELFVTKISKILGVIISIVIILSTLIAVFTPIFNPHLFQHHVQHTSYELQYWPKDKIWTNHDGVINRYRVHNQPSDDVLIKKVNVSWKYNNYLDKYLIDHDKHVIVKDTYYIPKDIKIVG